MTKPITRRSLLAATAAGAATLAMPTIIRSARANGSLNISTYDGYIPADFQEKFQKDTGIELNVRLVDDQGKLFNLLVAEANTPSTDIATVGAHRFPQFLKADLLQELDTGRLNNLDTINPIYRDADWLVVEGKRWGVPLVAGCHGLAYNTGAVADADATSWAPVFDEKHSGRITYIVLDIVQGAFAHLGYDVSFVSYIDQPDLAQKYVNEARDLVISKKHLVLKYTDSGTEGQQLFINDEVDVAYTDFGPAAKLVLEGLPIRFTVPDEGAMGYVHTFNISKSAANVDNAYTFLKAFLAEPGIGGALARSSGLVPAFADTKTGLSEVEQAAFSLTDKQLANIRFERAEATALKYTLCDKAAAEIRAA